MARRGAREALGPGNVGLCLSLASAGAPLWAVAALALASFLPSDGLASTSRHGPALSSAQCAQSLMATLPALLRDLGQTMSNTCAGPHHLTRDLGLIKTAFTLPTEEPGQKHRTI